MIEINKDELRADIHFSELRAQVAEMFGTSKLCADLDAEDIAGFPLWLTFAPLDDVLTLKAFLESEQAV